MLIIWTGMFLIALFQIPVLIKNNKRKEFIWFLIFWIIAGIYASLILGTFAGEISFVNHSELMIRFFTALGKKLGL